MQNKLAFLKLTNYTQTMNNRNDKLEFEFPEISFLELEDDILTSSKLYSLGDDEEEEGDAE